MWVNKQLDLIDFFKVKDERKQDQTTIETKIKVQEIAGNQGTKLKKHKPDNKITSHTREYN